MSVNQELKNKINKINKNKLKMIQVCEVSI